jgi:hypothetical protein
MINFLRRRWPGWFAAGWVLALSTAAHGAGLKTENVFLIVSDGLRWQEVFGGAEEILVSKNIGGVSDTNALRREFWRPTPAERRQALLPFVWGEIAQRGQIFGNQNKGSVVTVTNGHKFSYPGYNEMLTGSSDPRIDSNDQRPNPNVTVFEWLNDRSRWKGQVEVLATWDVFPYIFNIGRSHLPIWPAWEEKFCAEKIKAPAALDELLEDTTSPWDDMTYDSFLFQVAMDRMKHPSPRLVFVGFGETDEWAHEGRYDRYLAAARHVDSFVRQLWNAAQSMRRYRGKTTFIITADHGRGNGPENWKHHGADIEGSENDWMAVIGPDTPPLGERTQTTPRTEGQIASTIAALLGENYRAAFPQAAGPMADILGSQ